MRWRDPRLAKRLAPGDLSNRSAKKEWAWAGASVMKGFIVYHVRGHDGFYQHARFRL
jgi:hypothetical protein